MAKNVIPTDPRNVAETFVGMALAVYVNEGNLHLTMGVQRPKLGTRPGPDFETVKEVVVRLVMPIEVGAALAQAITQSLSPVGQAPQNQRAN